MVVDDGEVDDVFVWFGDCERAVGLVAVCAVVDMDGLGNAPASSLFGLEFALKGGFAEKLALPHGLR